MAEKCYASEISASNAYPGTTSTVPGLTTGPVPSAGYLCQLFTVVTGWEQEVLHHRQAD